MQGDLAICWFGSHHHATFTLHSDTPLPLSFPPPPPLNSRSIPCQVSALLLKQYRARFQGAPLTSTYRFLEQLVLGSLPSNPLVTHDTDTRHLRDTSFLTKALEHRCGEGYGKGCEGG